MQVKKLNLTDCLMLIVGSMIGSGIFIVPSAMSLQLGSPGLLLAAWLVTALLTIIAAISYGELAAMMPKAGGQYVYLKEAYGPLWGFLYGWTLFMVIQTGTIAAVAVAFAKFAGVFWQQIHPDIVVFNLFGLAINSQQLLAIAIVWVLTVTNFRDVKTGALVQNAFTFSKVGAIVLMLGAGLFFALQQNTVSLNLSFNIDLQDPKLWSVFSIALVGSIFSSDAWNNITFTGGEIENPQRNIPLSLFLGTSLVSMLYLFMVLMYVYILPFEAIQHAPQERVGTVFMQALMGSTGMYAMAALIMVSTFGCVNGLTLSGARVYYAMAKDGLFFRRASTLNGNGSPQVALMMQAVWATILTVSGSYGNLLDYVVIAVLFFYILTIVGIFVLRVKKPDAERPYKVWGYPILPFIYIGLASFICYQLLVHKPEFTRPGLLIVAAGIPVYGLVKWLQKKQATKPKL